MEHIPLAVEFCQYVFLEGEVLLFNLSNQECGLVGNVLAGLEDLSGLAFVEIESGQNCRGLLLQLLLVLGAVRSALDLQKLLLSGFVERSHLEGGVHPGTRVVKKLVN